MPTAKTDIFTALIDPALSKMCASLLLRYCLP